MSTTALTFTAALGVVALAPDQAHAACTTISSSISCITWDSSRDIHCDATADWTSYFDGMLGGASLAVLIVMLIKMPASVRQFFKKTRGADE